MLGIISFHNQQIPTCSQGTHIGLALSLLLSSSTDLPLNWIDKSGSDQQKNRDLGEKIGIMVQ